MLSPLSWLLLAMLLLALGLRRRARWLARTGTVLAVIAIVAMTPWAANALVGWLEAPRPSAGSCVATAPRTAVVLAGGADLVPAGPADFSALAITSRRRMERAVDWWHDQPGRSLIVSGGMHRQRTVPTATLMAAYARRLGVASNALRVDNVALTTRESAMVLAALQPPVPRRVVLVTSAMHMPRARQAMTRAGFQVCTLAADPRRVAFALPGSLVPQSSALMKTEAALHELVGMAYYHWLDARPRPVAD